MSLGVKLGYSQSENDANAESRNEENHAMHISYNVCKTSIYLSSSP